MLSTADSELRASRPPPETLPAWLYRLLQCPQCDKGGLHHGASALQCDLCAASYPIANGVPMLLRPDMMVDTAAVLSTNLGGVDPMAIERAFGTALRFRLNDQTLRGEFTQIVDRYAKLFQDAALPTALPDEATPTAPSLVLVTEYFNPVFEAGVVSFRSFRVRNSGTAPLATVGEKPFHLSYWLEDASGARREGLRSRFPIPLQPGHELTIPLRIEAPMAEGQYRITVMLVQEYVAWHEKTPVFAGEMIVSAAGSAGPALITPPHSGFFDFNQDLDRCGEMLTQAVAMVRERVEEHDIKILEVACGNDPQALRHYQEGTDVVACDLSFPQVQLGALSFARRNVAAAEHYAFAAADVFNPPFKPGSFHIIVVCAALHHFADVVDALRRFIALLAPGGRLVLMREPGKVVPEDVTYISELANGFNEQQFVLAEYETMFERSGLSVVYHRMDFECSYKVILKKMDS
jgi:SAM-dependent methyltransferase/uncharacterized protein YbaR (Trm112 family)